MEERVGEEQLRVLWGTSQLRTWQCLSLIMGPIEGPPMKQQQQQEDLQVVEGLPDDLVIKILTSLPVPKLFQVRLVRKTWNSLVRSPAFAQAWSMGAPSDECWLVMGRRLCRQHIQGAKEFKEFIAYSSSLGKWFHLPLDRRTNPSISSFLGLFSFRIPYTTEYLHLRHDLCIASSFAVSGAGGLMCCVIDGRHHRRYRVLVFNVLTGTVKMLPPPPYPTFARLSRNTAISMCFDPATPSYHVILSNGTGEFCIMEVYDSKTGCWKVAQPIASCTEFGSDVLHGDLFRYINNVFVAYNANRDSWSKIKLPIPIGSSHIPPAVLKFKGQLFMAAHWYEWDRERWTLLTYGFVVYRFQCACGGIPSWVEVAKTPSQFFSSYTPQNKYHVEDANLIGHGNLICMTTVNLRCASDDKGGEEYCPPLVYDLSLDTWYHLPFHRGSHNFRGLFAFQPRLDVTI